MPTPSKFVEWRRQMILQLLSAGASRTRAARAADIDDATLGRWIRKGQKAHPEGRWHAFYLDVVQAEAEPRLQALKSREEMDWRAAFRFLERAGEFDPPEPDPPTVITVILPGPDDPA
jgi:transposase-like protein